MGALVCWTPDNSYTITCTRHIIIFVNIIDCVIGADVEQDLVYTRAVTCTGEITTLKFFI